MQIPSADVCRNADRQRLLDKALRLGISIQPKEERLKILTASRIKKKMPDMAVKHIRTTVSGILRFLKAPSYLDML